MSGAQVDKSHYGFDAYGFEGRFVSYFWQLQATLDLQPSSVLEVGVGDRVFGNFIKDNTSIKYTSVDVAADLSPDFVADVRKLPFADNSFDVVCAFEVLEHLPFSEFNQALSELSRVARSHIVISLPHFGPMLSFSLKVPFLRELRTAFKIPFPREHHFNGQHHWEIGKRGFPLSRIRNSLAEHGKLVKDFVPFGSAYHHFFILAV